MMITSARLRTFAPAMDVVAATDWAPALEAARQRFGIASAAATAGWMGQLHVESQGFTRFEENLNYGTPARLDAMFSAVRGSADAADLIRRGPQAIANRVYANRNGNGSERSGDGWRFRGRGPIQQTGRAKYLQASAWTGIDLVAAPDQLLWPRFGALAAAGYWSACALNDDAERGNVDACTLAINGHAMAGAAERRQETARARRIFVA